MREVYYRVESVDEVPRTAAFVRIWRDGALPTAEVTIWGIECTTFPTDPDVALVRAGVARARYELLGVFVWVEDESLWHHEWGDLVH